MHDLFRRQLAVYADHHRDARNLVAHLIGIPALFVAVLIGVSIVGVDSSGRQDASC